MGRFEVLRAGVSLVLLLTRCTEGYIPKVADVESQTVVASYSANTTSATLYALAAPGYDDPFYVFNVSADSAFAAGYA